MLLVRRGVRPAGGAALTGAVSIESIVIGLFIATLMVTFLLTFAARRRPGRGRVNWWVHALVILAFLALIPASKHFHLRAVADHGVPEVAELGNVPNLDFEKEQVGPRDGRRISGARRCSTRSRASSAAAAR